MAQQVVVDTDIIIDFGMDRKDAIQTLGDLEQKFVLSLSVITAMELYVGCCSKSDLEQVDKLISNFKMLSLTEKVSAKAFEWMREFRSTYGVEINDMLIGATAQTSEMNFISKNQKHYRFLPDLKLLSYPFTL